MAGYLGTKAALLSTTAADVVGNAEIGGDLTVGGTFTSQGIDDNASATAMTLDASGNVGIGTSSPARQLHVNGSAGTLRIQGTSVGGYVEFVSPTSTSYIGHPASISSGSTDDFGFYIAGTERMRIDSSGNLLVGQTSASNNVPGMYVRPSSSSGVIADGTTAWTMGRLNSDGVIANFLKDGSTVGGIGVRTAGTADVLVVTFDSGNSGVGLTGTTPSAHAILPADNGTAADNLVDLGIAAVRFNDVYATNGTIQTSDRNEKQDIDVLSDAEQRVAVACKGLLRKFRWKDAVAEKGDNARIHFGIIAQDLQDAFTAEGLDAGRYAMFISSTWWEHSVDVPAVEAVAAVDATYDEDGNELTPAVEAVEAKDAYTRTDTYETLEEAPEGATERTRLGVRYPELLAFIIGAM